MAKRWLTHFTDSFAGGMNDARGVVRLRKDHVRWAYNARIQPDGSIKARWGSRNTNAAAPVAGRWNHLTSFRTSAGADVWVAIESTIARIYTSTDYGATWTNLMGVAGTTTPITSCVITDAGTRKLVIAGFAGRLYVLTDATTIAEWTLASTQIPVANPQFVEAHGDRLWLAEADTQSLWGSKISDPDNWVTPDALNLPIGGDGEPIRGLKSMGEHLLVLKETKIAYVDGFGNSDIIVAAGTRGVPSGTSVFANTAVLTPYGLIFATSAGVYAFSPSSGVKLLSGAADTDWRGMYWPEVTDPYPTRGLIPLATYLPESFEYIVGVQSISTLATYGLDRLFRVNLQNGAITLDTKAGEALTAMMAARPNADEGRLSLVTMGAAGFSRLHDVEGIVKDDTLSDGTGGSGFRLDVVTSFTDFGTPGRKRLRRIALQGYQGSGGGTFNPVNGFADIDNDGSGGAWTSDLSFVFTKDRSHTKIGRVGLVGESFCVQVSAIPTATFRAHIESIRLYAEPLESNLDL